MYVLFAGTLLACTDAADLSEVGSAVVTSNALSINGLTTNSVALNALSKNGLTENRIALNDLVVDAPGREVARYLVSCALRADQEMTVTVEGTEYTFPGQLGLAPRWIDRPLRKSEQGWVSACMLSRVNAYDVSVHVSLRAKHRALSATADELAAYPIQEAAFYGDIFTDGEPIVAVACLGKDQAASETGSLEDRDCAEPDPTNPGKTICGFTYAGHCADFTPAPPSEWACKQYRATRLDDGERDHRADRDAADDDDAADQKHDRGDDPAIDGGYYDNCHDEPGKGKWRGAERFRQVITVYLQ